MNTQTIHQTEQLSLNGEVVEIFKQENSPSATFYIQPFTLKLDHITDVDLGETATLEVSISIRSIHFQQNNRRTHE